MKVGTRNVSVGDIAMTSSTSRMTVVSTTMSPSGRKLMARGPMKVS